MILLSFAAKQAINRHKMWLRCDAKASMLKLVAYYVDLGLRKERSILYKHSGQEAVLLEGSPSEIFGHVVLVR